VFCVQIRNVDKIYVVEDGKVVEEGTHDELMAVEGPYYHLVHSQVYIISYRGLTVFLLIFIGG